MPIRSPRLLPRGRRVLIADGLVLLWTIAWIIIGIQVGTHVRGLTKLSDTVQRSGQALEASGTMLRQLGQLPLVGGQLGNVAGKVEAAAASAQASGQASRGDIESLSVLLAVAVGLIPTAPLLAFYLVIRVPRAREAAVIGRELARREDDPAFQEYLARRAVVNVPYRRVHAVVGLADPWQEIGAGRSRPLARLELARLGLAAPRAWRLEGPAA